jgi:polyphenol oxidase
MKINETLFPTGIQGGFFTRQGGVSEGVYKSLNTGYGSQDNPDHVLENRQRIQSSLSLNYLLSCYQVHGSDVVHVEKPWRSTDQRPSADAMVTKLPFVGLGILTADCGPVLLADAEKGVIGAAHAGWKGALGGVLENTLAAMENLGAQRENIQAWIGPCIHQPSYEVDEGFYNRFLDHSSHNKAFFEQKTPSHWVFNLPSYIANRLEKSHIKEVSHSPLCTYVHEDRFFSFRRATHRHEQDYGRQLSVIALCP